MGYAMLRKRRQVNGALIISIGLHIVLGALLVWVLSIPTPLRSWLQSWQAQPVPEQRITYVAVPSSEPSRVGRSGGNNKSVTREARPPRVVPPTTVPSTVPPAPANPRPQSAPGTGPVVGAGGAGEGVTPSYNDPRIWLPPGPVAEPHKTTAQRLDSALASTFAAHLDSMQALGATAGKAPGDWTFEKNGKKYGIDPKWIHFGKFSIPTAILALLPIKGGSNPEQVREDRALNFQRGEIMEQAQRAMNEAEFREAVKRIRERKQREHDAEMKEREKQKKPEPQPQPSTVVQP
jgi:hypothetical protein